MLDVTLVEKAESFWKLGFPTGKEAEIDHVFSLLKEWVLDIDLNGALRKRILEFARSLMEDPHMLLSEKGPEHLERVKEFIEASLIAMEAESPLSIS